VCLATEGLFIEVSEKMEWLTTHVDSLHGTLQEAPEVFPSIRENIAIDGPYRVVNKLVAYPIPDYRRI
jgi:hypothetical protein